MTPQDPENFELSQDDTEKTAATQENVGESRLDSSQLEQGDKSSELSQIRNHENEESFEPDSIDFEANDEIDPAQDTPEDQMRRVEAALFLSRSPVNSRKLAGLANLEDGTKARTIVKLINEKYDQVGRAFQIKQIAFGYQLMTRPQFAKWLRRLDQIRPTVRLTNPAMETLSVVAYRQPILKSELEAIRGVSCGEMLRQLLEKGLVKIAGRSEELGRPFLYATSKLFLETFGLSTLDALPRSRELKGQGLPKPSLSFQNNSESETTDSRTTDPNVISSN